MDGGDGPQTAIIEGEEEEVVVVEEEEKLLRLLARVEFNINSGNVKIAEGIEYFIVATRLIQTFSQSRIAELKLSARAWKRILLPLLEEGKRKEKSFPELLKVAIKFYEQVGDEERLGEILSLAIIQGSGSGGGGGGGGELLVFVPLAIRVIIVQLDNNPGEGRLWNSFISILKVAQMGPALLYMLPYARMVKRVDLSLLLSSHQKSTTSNRSLDFEFALVTFLFEKDSVSSSLMLLFKRRIQSPDTSIILRAVAFALFIISGTGGSLQAMELFLKFTLIIQEYAGVGITLNDKILWISLLLRSICGRSFVEKVSPSLWIWICSTLNIKVQALLSVRFSILDDLLLGLLLPSEVFNFELFDQIVPLFQDCIATCTEQSISLYLSFYNGSFQLGVNLIGASLGAGVGSRDGNGKNQDIDKYRDRGGLKTRSRKEPASKSQLEINVNSPLKREIRIMSPSTSQLSSSSLHPPPPASVEQKKIPSPELSLLLSAEIQLLKLQKEELAAKTAQTKSKVSRDSLFVLDTNVLVDNVDTIRDIIGQRSITCAIPIIVIEELKGLLKAPRQSLSAQNVLDYIETGPSVRAFGSLLGLTMSGSTCFILECRREGWPNDPNVKSNDDAILYAAANSSFLQSTIVVSDDINMSLKGKAQGILVIPWRVFFELWKDP